MGISVIASASLFSVFTYIAPLLREVTGLDPREVSGVLILFGIGITVGNIFGGRLADWRLMPSMIGMLAALAAVLAIFAFTSHFAWPAIVTIFVWGMIDFALVSPLQIRVVDKARDAPNLASTLNQGAFNLGNAAGAWIGGTALTLGLDYAALPWVGSALALGALCLSLLSQAIDRRVVAAAAAA
jgi:DHA1 family inner membrane transport protein